jgi:penicillin amidase
MHRSLVLALVLACRPPIDEDPAETSPIFDVAQAETWSLPGLSGPAEVLRTESDVPHIYAANEVDAARVLGFVYARDRLFTLDLARRLSLGEVSGLLGDLGTDIDVDSRLIGMTHVADGLFDNASPTQLELFGAYAEGINAAITAVQAGSLPAPSELDLAGPLLGADDPTALLTPFDARDVCGVLATLVYQLAFNRDEITATQAADAIANGLYAEDDALAELRSAGAAQLFADVSPLWDVVSAVGWDPGNRPNAAPPVPRPPAAGDQLGRLADRLLQHGQLLGMRVDDIRGSNAWAVTGAASADGRALMAGDGHLPLTVPSLFWQVGLDTAELGGGDMTLLGLALPGTPAIAVGTNGHVAWSQTRLRSDPLDWYLEELTLTDGLPSATVFRGGSEPVVALTETLDVAGVLGSAARTETFTRYTTFDGRFLVSIEGEVFDAPTDGPSVRTADGWVVPGDTDGDGRITGISMDYAAFDDSQLTEALRGFAQARDVETFREATRYLVAYGQNIVAADTSGSVLYTSYQSVPCRDDLPRDADGWAPGADPTLLLDGTQYGGFTIPTVDGVIQDGDSDAGCAIPFDDHPWSIDPDSGWVMTANQDPGGMARDGDLSNDAWYLGGPWDGGFRAKRLETLLDEAAGAGATLEDMTRIQADAEAGDAVVLLPALLAILQGARDAAVPAWAADPRLAEATDRLQAWLDGGAVAANGVETFYNDPAGQQDDAVATMIYYAWQARLQAAVFDDEGFPESIWRPNSRTGITRALARMLEGRGAGNPADDAAWNPATEESAFWDDLGTPDVETAEDIVLASLSEALDALTASSSDPGLGGFGTDDMDQWLWGLRHMVRFESLLAGFLGDNPLFLGLTRPFAITPERLPLGESIPSDDPRADLPAFPRQGANGSVDSASHGYGTDDYTYTSGPAFRMVFALGPEGVEGVNVLPGGQSALTDSAFFDDQAALWLGNEVLPLRFEVEDVVAGATRRESFTP